MLRKSIKHVVTIAVFFFALACFMGCGVKTEAASKVKTLKANQTYTTKLTGTAKHKIRYTEPKKNRYEEDAYRNFRLYIDGKLKKSINSNWSYSYTVELLTVNSNRILIAISDHEDNDYTDFYQIYEYKNGKLTLLKDIYDLTVSTGTKANRILTGWARGSLYSFDGKTLVLEWHDSTTATGNIRYIISYTLKGTKITKNTTSNTVRSIRTGKVNPKWTAKYTLKAYKTAGGNTLAFTVKPNQIVTIKRMTVKNGKRYLEVTNSSGKTGWILNPNTYDEKRPEGYFKECFFAG